jgi:ParB/RepB/Spo0J family partition protein
MSKKTKKKLALADLLKAHLDETGQSQRAFAEAHNLPKTTVQQIASGTVETVSVDNARLLAPILGRSIAELIGLDESEIGSSSDAAANGDPAVRLIPHGAIVQSPINPRKTFDEAGIDELAESIAENGVMQNLVVRVASPSAYPNIDSKGAPIYELIAGERRYRAVAKLIAAKRLPANHAISCRVIMAGENEARALALLENLQRIDLAPLEEADAFRVLHEQFEWSTQQIADRIHKSQRFVQQRLALAMKLSPAVKDALAKGELKIDQARALTAADEKEQKGLLKDIKTNPYGLNTAEDIRKRLTRNAVLSTVAIFDLKKYGGATREDDEGNLWLLDANEFKKLQKAALEDLKADKEAEGWAFVEIQDGGWFDSDDYEKERTKKKKEGIVIIAMDWRGNVEVQEGLVPSAELFEAGSSARERLAAYIENAQAQEAEDAEEDNETPEERKERWRIENEQRQAENEKREKEADELNEKLGAFLATNPLLKARFALARIYSDRDFDNGEWSRISALSADELLAEFTEMAFRSEYDEDSDGALILPYSDATEAEIAIVDAAGLDHPDWFKLQPERDSSEDDEADEGDESAGDEDGESDDADEAEEAA